MKAAAPRDAAAGDGTVGHSGAGEGRSEPTARQTDATDAGDRALADRVRWQRDPVAFRALYRRHSPALYGTAFRLVGHAADAEDAVHDTWARAVEGLPRFEWRSSLRTWLTGILLNRLRELDRQGRDMLPLDEAALAPEPPVVLPRGVDPMDLDAAIAALPPGYRRVLVLHDVEGFTHEDIARLLDIDPGTSKSQLSRARRRLRRALSGER
ncbi:MAG TPA: RNA polymerase sigma factor [Gemmatimonadaceae bacterium]|nr:RNA polymerase sigma factor [Gemmatimonadaceae bacterium]